MRTGRRAIGIDSDKSDIIEAGVLRAKLYYEWLVLHEKLPMLADKALKIPSANREDEKWCVVFFTLNTT